MLIFHSEFGVEDLMVSVGSYLGLFIGLSLSDVCGFIIDFLASISKTIKSRIKS